MLSGIVRTLASICFSSAIGRWVDQAPNRLKTLQGTISINRMSVIGASAMWFFIVGSSTGNSHEITHEVFGLGGEPVLKGSIFALILLLGILENLSASSNMLSIERDWVVAAASLDGFPYDLTHLNSAMRRIDLICKLIAPTLISVLVSAMNVRIGVLVVGTMNAVSWTIEIWCARRVWNTNSRLRKPKATNEQVVSEDIPTLPPLNARRRTCYGKVCECFRSYIQDYKSYFSSVVWIPSLSLSFLHISALAYSATFITHLLAMGFSLDLITVARAVGSVVEISSTVLTPVGVQILSRAQNHGRLRGRDSAESERAISTMALLEGDADEESKTETGLERLGLWGISFQLINLVRVGISCHLSCIDGF